MTRTFRLEWRLGKKMAADKRNSIGNNSTNKRFWSLSVRGAAAVFICILLAEPARATTHWVVTEDGKIQQQVTLRDCLITPSLSRQYLQDNILIAFISDWYSLTLLIQLSDRCVCRSQVLTAVVCCLSRYNSALVCSDSLTLSRSSAWFGFLVSPNLWPQICPIVTLAQSMFAHWFSLFHAPFRFQVDSPLNLKHPHHLVLFMQQETRVNYLKKLEVMLSLTFIIT